MNAKQILEVINEITMIHNQIGADKMFLAGSNMISLQQRLVQWLQEEERNSVHDG